MGQKSLKEVTTAVGEELNAATRASPAAERVRLKFHEEALLTVPGSMQAEQPRGGSLNHD